jgi:hypothetical protein
MKTAISFLGSTAHISVPENDWKSHGKPSEQHIFFKAPENRPPLNHLFIKRHKNRKSTAHDFLVRLTTTNHVGRSIPLFFGYVFHGGWHYYVFQYLAQCGLLSKNTDNRKAHHDRTITPELAHSLVRSSVNAFSFMNASGYYYPDYSFENILVNYSKNGVFLIDVDSCFPFSVTAKPADCRQTWWTLFAEQNISDLKYLNITMVMSMALVACHALSEIRIRGAGANVSDVLRASPKEQRFLFAILDMGKEEEFIRVFRTPRRYRRRIPLHLKSWKTILGKMRNNENVPWDEVTQFTSSMLLLTGMPQNDYGLYHIRH